MEKHDLDDSSSPDNHGSGAVVQSTYIKPQARKLHDSNITFEEYNYYAEKTREEEKHVESPKLNLRALWSRKTKNDAGAEANGESKQINLNLAKEENRMQVSDEEWTNASRAFRTASWGAVFYLITTDILGPFAVPYAIGTLGYGPGIALFTVFGFFGG